MLTSKWTKWTQSLCIVLPRFWNFSFALYSCTKSNVNGGERVSEQRLSDDYKHFSLVFEFWRMRRELLLWSSVAIQFKRYTKKSLENLVAAKSIFSESIVDCVHCSQTKQTKRNQMSHCLTTVIWFDRIKLFSRYSNLTQFSCLFHFALNGKLFHAFCVVISSIFNFSSFNFAIVWWNFSIKRKKEWKASANFFCILFSRSFNFVA